MIDGGAVATFHARFHEPLSGGIVNTSSGTLNVNGNIDQNGYALTLESDSTTIVNAQISGSGGLVKTGGSMVILAADISRLTSRRASR